MSQKIEEGKERRTPLVTAVLMVMLMAAFWAYTTRIRINQEISGQTYLSQCAQELQQTFHQSHALLRYLQDLTRKSPDITPLQFQRKAALWLGQHDYPALRVVQLAKDAVVSHIHPLTGNEASRGHDLLADPARRKEARAAYMGFKTVTTPVVTLRQGGKGIIHRMSIRLPQSETPWGLAIVVQDWERLRELSGFNHREGEFRLSIRGRAGITQAWGNAFVGEDPFFTRKGTLLQTIDVPGGQWQLALTRNQTPPDHKAVPLIIGGNLLLLLGFCLTRKNFQNKDWPIPLVTAGTLLVLISIFFSLYLFTQRVETRRTLAHQATMVQTRLSHILNRHADFGRLLAIQRGDGKLSPAGFREKGRAYAQVAPELLNLTWVDAGYVIRDVTPRQGNDQILGLGVELTEPRRASRLARELGSGVYTRPFWAIQGGWSFEYWVPVFDRDHRFKGLIVMAYAMDHLVEQILDSEFPRNLSLSLVNQRDETLAGDPLPTPGKRRRYDRRLIPPGHGIRLVLSTEGATVDRGIMAMGAMGLLLVLVIFISLYRLQKSRRKLARQNILLARTKGRLEDEKELVRTTLDTLQEGVITLTPDLAIETVNTAAQNLLSREPAPGLKLLETLDLTHRRGGPIHSDLKRALNRATQAQRACVIGIKDNRTFQCVIRPLDRKETTHSGFVLIFHDVTQARIREERLLHRASHDPLTQCLNRQGFRQKYRAVTAMGSPEDTHSLAFLDLDRFKAVNDTAGHAVGDQLLMELSRRIQGQLRNSDILARMGGDEFVILLPGCPLGPARALIERIREQITGYSLDHREKRFRVGVSIGVVTFSSGEVSTAVLDRADKACYQAKQRGKNRVVCWETP